MSRKPQCDDCPRADIKKTPRGRPYCAKCGKVLTNEKPDGYGEERRY